MKNIIIVIIMIFFSMVADADNVHITYVSFVDPNLGFYKVTDSTTHNPAPYVARVLTINQGDSVIWKNDADPSSPVTIVSEQNLFPDAELKLINDVFSYTFTQAGIFTFYVKEREIAKQTIIVNSEGFPPTTSESITPEPTPVITIVPTMTSLPLANATNLTSNVSNVSANELANVSVNESTKNDSQLSLTSIASIMVAIISILTMFSTRKR